ncbi:MAG: manganese efflux pump MntP family protein [Treponema sp.]|jgi:putative Mn2+ efflux pump MntP|nr:manganese efflux pump MntP family protein [Treponema sp.]
MIALLIIALGLSMDAFAVSVGAGTSIRDLRPFHAVRASFFFGLFQFIMPLAGCYLGEAFASYIEAFDHWIAFALLVFIGGKMLVETPRRKNTSGGTVAGGKNAGSGESDKGRKNPQAQQAPSSAGDIRGLRTLLTLSVATSIDAFAAGISLSIMGYGVWGSAAVIGGVTFLVCLCGFEFGRRAGMILEKRAQLAGGIVLIGIGVKILAEHLWG